MKKILFLLLFIPCLVNATITDYYMEATILENGDVSVKEAFTLDGTFNGFERELLVGNTIYDGTSINIVSVKGISDTNIDFETLTLDGDSFELVEGAASGDYGVYTLDINGGTYSLKIFNPSHYNKIFYIEYIIKNMAIKHKDVGELGYNIFTSLNEDLTNLNVRIKVPGNKNIRAWGHGSLLGLVKIESNESVLVTLDYLNAYEAVDVRVVFDKNILSESTKVLNENALDKIIKEETEKADEANKIREEEKKKLEEAVKKVEEAVLLFENTRKQKDKDNARLLNEELLFGTEYYDVYLERLNNTLSIEEENRLRMLNIGGKVINVILIIYSFFNIYLALKFYKNYDKEYDGLDIKYYRDFPASYGPEIVESLFNGSASTNGFSASILNLIYKKNIVFEEIDNKNYKLKLSNKIGVTPSEEALINCVFDNNNEITLKDLKKEAKNNYDDFLSKYKTWENTVSKESENEKFYEKIAKGRYILYTLLIFILFFLGEMLSYANGLIIGISIVISVFALIYYASAKKKTVKGNDEYIKWNGLKNFMNDFGRMHEKELPEIILWEKYLVYATVFGCAKKLAKDMKIKVQELENTNNNFTYNYVAFNSLVKMPSVINSSIKQVKSSADNAYSVAHSTSSSGSGFGGGFSGGGGSFGGGGGGGRF